MKLTLPSDCPSSPENPYVYLTYFAEISAGGSNYFNTVFVRIRQGGRSAPLSYRLYIWTNNLTFNISTILILEYTKSLQGHSYPVHLQ
jgi:hypothetical protein